MKRLTLLAGGWLAIATLGCGSAVSTPAASRSATPTVTATPTLRPSVADTFYLTDVHSNRILDRVRWDGSSAGTVTLPTTVACCDNNVFPSPDGYERGPQLVACTVINDRAIVFDTVMGGVAAVHIYRLSTGKELDPWPGGTSFPLVVIASPDARYLAGGGFGGGTIWSTTTGQALGTLPGEPWGFSLDGSRVVVEGTSPVYKVLDWRTGTVVFQAPGETFPPRVLPRPGSPDLLIGVTDARGPRYYGPTTGSAWIVGDSGVTPLLDQAPAGRAFLASS
jgi:hypothetical protein